MECGVRTELRVNVLQPFLVVGRPWTGPAKARPGGRECARQGRKERVEQGRVGQAENEREGWKIYGREKERE